MKKSQKYKQSIKKVVCDDLDNPFDVYLYWKGRVGLYALLKSVGIEQGDEVIVQAYTCVVVANVIIYHGAKPVYVDIEKSSFNMNVESIEKAITPKTKIILCQNTYGLSSNLDKIRQLAASHSILTIEDCAHGFGGSYNGHFNGTLCDAAFYSTQWNKPYSTGLGGIVITKNERISNGLRNLEKEIVKPGMAELTNLKLLYLARRYLISDFSYWPLVKLYRFLSNTGILVGSSSAEEISSTEIPKAFFKSFSELQAEAGLRGIRTLEDTIAKRKKVAHEYTDFLNNHGKNHVSSVHHTNHTFLYYPVLIRDREDFMSKAVSEHVQLNDWFNSPLHPVTGDLSNWGLDKSAFPIADYCSSHVVNLPTNIENHTKVIQMLDRNLANIV